LPSPPHPIVTTASEAPANDGTGASEELPTIVLTPELEAGLLALAPLLELVQARQRGRRPVRRSAPALPPRPEMTPEMKKDIQRSLRRKGFQ
jgi:hypothetical protein